MTDVWSERAEAFRESPTHREGPDLDLLVDWCEPGPGVTALDVATGGGHVARRLREAGCEVVTVDPAPGMRPDVLASAEHLPFAEASFDVVACRIAAHHFTNVRAAMSELARVARRVVVIEDNTFVSEQAEEAERIRDPSHVRCYSESEWRGFLEEVGLEVEALERFERPRSVDDWLARVGCEGAEAVRVKELLGERITEGRLELPAILVKGRKR